MYGNEWVEYKCNINNISEYIEERIKVGRAQWNWQHMSQKDNYTIPCLCTCLHILSENKWNHWDSEIHQTLQESTLTRWAVQSGDWNQYIKCLINYDTIDLKGLLM